MKKLFLCLGICLVFILPVTAQNKQTKEIPQKQEQKQTQNQKQLQIKGKTTTMPQVRVEVKERKNPNAKAGEGATINIFVDSSSSSSTMTFMFFDPSYISGTQTFTDIENAFKQGGTARDNVWSAAKYRFPDTDLFSGWNSKDTTVVVPAGKYDIVNTDYDPDWWISHGNYADGICPVGHLNNFEFKDGYYYAINILVGAGINDLPPMEIAPFEAAIVYVDVPAHSTSLGSNETVSVTFANVGNFELKNANLYLQVNANTPEKYEWAGNLGYYPATEIKDFNVNLSAKGIYNIKAWITTEYMLSDTLRTLTSDTMKRVVSHAPDSATIPWRDDFDLEHTAWEVIDDDNTSTEGIWNMFELDDGDITARYEYSETLRGNDFLVALSPFNLKAGQDYQVIASAMSIGGYDETIEMYCGTNPNPLTMERMGRYTVKNFQLFVEYGFNFTVENDGKYYIAIKAASEPDMYYMYVNYVKVDTGVFIPVVDLSISAAEWSGIYPSCELPQICGAAMIILNSGSEDMYNYTYSYRVDTGEWKISDTLEVLAAGGAVILNIDSIKLPEGINHTLTIAVSSISPDNDTVKLKISQTDVLDIPFKSNFGDQQGVENWHGQSKWVFNGQSGEYVYDHNTHGVGLMSDCITLEADKPYAFDIAYWGVSKPELETADPPFKIYTSFDVLYGKTHSPVDSFTLLASYNKINTQATAGLINGKLNPLDYDTAVFEFSVKEAGDYVFAIYPTEFTKIYEALVIYQASPYLGIRYINIAEPDTTVKPVDTAGITLPVSAAANALRVYPVPATDIITVEGAVKGLLSVIDINGRVVMRNIVDTGRVMLNVSSLPKGVYMLRNSGPNNSSSNIISSRSVKFIKK